MANRILPAAQAIFIGPSPATGAQASGNIFQIHRAQSYNLDWQREERDIQQLGRLAPLDRKSTTLPTVNFQAAYLSTNVRNESGMGLYVGGDQSAVKFLIDNSQDTKNIYVRLAANNSDAEGYTATDGGVIGIGNSSLNSYQAQGAVGDFPTVNVGFQGLELSFTTTSSGFDTPAINPANGLPITGVTVQLPYATSGLGGQVTALEAGDITVDIAGAGVGLSSICIQSYNLSIDLNREAQQCLGNKYPTSYELAFPINATLSVDAFMKDFGTGRLSTSNCQNQKYNVSVTLRAPTCDGSVGATKVKYTLQGATLGAQTYSTDVGTNQMSTNLSFTSSLGGSGDLLRNVFISGSIV